MKASVLIFFFSLLLLAVHIFNTANASILPRGGEDEREEYVDEMDLNYNKNGNQNDDLEDDYYHEENEYEYDINQDLGEDNMEDFSGQSNADIEGLSIDGLVDSENEQIKKVIGWSK